MRVQNPAPGGQCASCVPLLESEFETEAWDGVDLDLSVAFYGDEKVNFVFYGNPKVEPLGAIHSGDRRSSGKNGAVEYVDFDIKKCLQNGIRYAGDSRQLLFGREVFRNGCGVLRRDGS